MHRVADCLQTVTLEGCAAPEKAKLQPLTQIQPTDHRRSLTSHHLPPFADSEDLRPDVNSPHEGLDTSTAHLDPSGALTVNLRASGFESG